MSTCHVVPCFFLSSIACLYCNNCNWFIGDLSILLFHTGVVVRTFPHCVFVCEKALMSNITFASPHNCIFLLLLNVIHDLIIGHDCLVHVIVDQSNKMYSMWVSCNISIMFFFCSNNPNIVLLPILMHQGGLILQYTNQLYY